VAERIPEIGVRMALGAQPSNVVTMILRQGAMLIGAGLMLGLAGALLLRHQMATMVFGVGTVDPLSYAAACGVLTLSALAACAIPARRASKLDPVTALRME
jgi:putative ABC transport system permease protein